MGSRPAILKATKERCGRDEAGGSTVPDRSVVCSAVGQGRAGLGLGITGSQPGTWSWDLETGWLLIGSLWLLMESWGRQLKKGMLNPSGFP